MRDHLELAVLLEETARHLREKDANPDSAFKLSKTLPEDLGQYWSRSPLNRSKAFRALLVDHWVNGLRAVLEGLDWQGRVEVSSGQVIVDLDGVRMDVGEDLRFFRKSGRAAGTSLLTRLRDFSENPECIVDIGANIGEISLFFSRHLPSARVLAIEASSENLAKFELNRSLQTFPTENLQLIHAAVADREGMVDITVGAADMNTLLIDEGLERLRSRGSTGTEKVNAITVDTVVAATGGGPIDLMKIDIEGAEPFLAPALARNANVIKTIFMEFSVFNTLEAYLDLDNALATAGYRVFDAKMRRISEMEAWLSKERERAPSVNVWYIRSDLLGGFV